jgi:hypothetical protein
VDERQATALMAGSSQQQKHTPPRWRHLRAASTRASEHMRDTGIDAPWGPSDTEKTVINFEDNYDASALFIRGDGTSALRMTLANDRTHIRRYPVKN